MPIYVPGKLVFDSGNAPAAIAGVAPTLDYRFAREKREIETVSLLDKLTYTGGNGTFVGSDGYIQRATTNAPRFDHDPLSRVSKGLLVEESRENLLLRSEEFDNASWETIRVTVSSNTQTAPNGALTADTLTDSVDESVTTHLLLQDISWTSGVAYTVSSWFKAGTLNEAGFGFPSSAFGSLLVSRFNLSTGGIELVSTGVTASSEQFADGWWRCTATATATTTASGSIQIRPMNTGTSYQGDGIGTVHIWGTQIETGTPSTYIPTTASTVTRTADSATIDGTGVLTGTYTIIEKPAGCAVESGGNIELQAGYTAERVMVFPASLSAQQITDIRSAM